MRIVILTGRLPHHKYLCLGMAKHFNVVEVIVSKEKDHQYKDKFRKMVREVKRNGLVYTAIRLAGKRIGLPLKSNYVKLEELYFPGVEEEFDRDLSDRVFMVNDINSESALSHITSLLPDVVICLGGGIYGQPLIDSVPLMLNWHSGISPIYNGACSVEFAFANGHPYLIGGTLMLINAKVDGGDILAHHFTDIEPGDTPGKLFMKTVKAAPDIYIEFIRHLEHGKPYVAVEQPPPLFNTMAADWTVYQSLTARKIVQKGLVNNFIRPAKTICYWQESNPDCAREKLHKTIDRIILAQQI